MVLLFAASFGTPNPWWGSATPTTDGNRLLVELVAAVADDHLAGDEIAVARAEEDHRADEIVRLLDALEGAAAQACLAEGQDVLAGVLLAERRAGRERVHVDVVVAQLAGEGAGEAHDAGLGGHIVG